eukprot:PhM_4_TR14996/c0_g1_i1/m.74722/K17914/KIF13; kinesin family member 13
MTDDSGAVRVYVRVRPFVERELRDSEKPVFRANVAAHSLSTLDPKTLARERDTNFFDGVLWSFSTQSRDFASQDDVFRTIGLPMIENIFRGYNACVFAYGQTGSGKTHTMMGRLGDAEEEGLIPRLCAELFRRASRADYSIEATYIEIYNERVLDLLNPDGGRGDADLRVRQHPTTGPFVEGLVPAQVASVEDVLALVTKGNAARTTAETKMNDRSSRSHAILSLGVTEYTTVGTSGSEMRTRGRFSRVYMVDLAGSERVTESGSVGQNFVEATNINLSLVTLGRCITTLADLSIARKAGKKSVMRPPYRESMLTWILSESIGGNSRTFMIANVSPSILNYDQSINTLRYASRAREVVNVAVVNEDPLLQQLRTLQQQLERQQSGDPLYVKKLEDRLANLTDQLRTEQAQETQHRMRVATLQERVSELETERRDLLRRYDLTQSELKRLQGGGSGALSRNTSAARLTPSLGADGTTLSASSVSEPHHQLAELERDRRDLENRLAAERAKHLSVIRQVEHAASQRVEAMQRDREAAVGESQSKLAEMQAKNDQLQARLADVTQKLADVSNEVGNRADAEAMHRTMSTDLQNKVRTLENRLESMKGLSDDLLQLRCQLQTVQSEKISLDKQLQTAQVALSATEQRALREEENATRAEALSGKLQSQLDRKISEADEMRTQIDRLGEQLQDAESAAQADQANIASLQDTVQRYVDSERVLKADLEQLHTQVSALQMKEEEHIAKELKHDAVEKELKERALSMRVELDHMAQECREHVYRREEAVRERNEMESTVLQNEIVIEKLVAERQTASHDLESMRLQQQSQARELVLSEQAIDDLKSIVAAFESDLRTTTNREVELKKTLQSAQTKNAALTDEVRELRTKSEEMSTAATSRETELLNHIRELNDDVAALRETVAEGRRAQMHVEELQQKVEIMGTRSAEVSGEVVDLKAETSRVATELKNKTEECDVLHATVATLQASLEAIEKDTRSSTAREIVLDQELQITAGRVGVLEDEVKSLRSERDTVAQRWRESVQDAEGNAERVRAELTVMASQLFEAQEEARAATAQRVQVEDDLRSVQKKFERAMAEEAAARSGVVARTQEVVDLQEQNRVLTQQLADAQSNAAALHDDVGAGQSVLEQTKSLLATVEKERDSIRVVAEEARASSASAQQRYVAVRAEYDALRSERDHLADSVRDGDALQAQLDRVSANHGELVESYSKACDEAAAARAELAVQQTEAVSLRAQLKRRDDERLVWDAVAPETQHRHMLEKEEAALRGLIAMLERGDVVGIMSAAIDDATYHIDTLEKIRDEQEVELREQIHAIHMLECDLDDVSAERDKLKKQLDDRRGYFKGCLSQQESLLSQYEGQNEELLSTIAQQQREIAFMRGELEEAERDITVLQTDYVDFLYPQHAPKCLPMEGTTTSKSLSRTSSSCSSSSQMVEVQQERKQQQPIPPLRLPPPQPSSSSSSSALVAIARDNSSYAVTHGVEVGSMGSLNAAYHPCTLSPQGRSPRTPRSATSLRSVPPSTGPTGRPTNRSSNLSRHQSSHMAAESTFSLD